MATILAITPVAIQLFPSNSKRYPCYLHRTMRIGQARIHIQKYYQISFIFNKRRKLICAVSKDAEESFKKTVEVDRLIDALREASDKELPQLVVENVLAFNESFWIRLAARADTCKSDDDKKDYEELALSVMNIVDRLVHKTKEKIDSSTGVLKAILEPVLDEVEEISWPVSDSEALSLMEKEINQREQDGQLDEGFLSEVNAQLRQAKKDGDKPGLEAMLQKVLQLYASRVLSKRSYAKKGNEVLKAEQFLESIIKAPEEEWNKLLINGMTVGKGDISPEELYAVIKKRMERTLIRTEAHNSPKLSTTPSIAVEIRGACKASRDPPTCESALTDSGNLPSELTTPLIIQSAVNVSSQNNDKAKDMVKAIMDASTGNQNRTDAAKVCMEVLGYAESRVGLTGQAFTRGQIKDARAWMSAVMVYQYDCWSALRYVNGTSQVSQTMAFLNSLIGYSSNALGMLVNYDIYGENTGSWTPPKTERDGFWEGSGSGESGQAKVGVPSGLKPDVTVCKEGGCNYKTVQEAVNAAPDNEVTRKFVIWIKAGLYEEKVRVPLEKKNVVFLGDGIGKTVITGSLNVGMAGVTTYETATVGVAGDGFMASGITFQNTAGPVAHQAVAFRSDSDLSVIENCEFIGNQDTLYAHALRQYYKSCRIQGNVDFIFGNSAAFFQECDILIAPRQLNPEKGEKNAVTAHGRIDPAQSTGFVFQNCLINGTDKYMALYYKKPKVHKNYLGRPWKEYSRTVFIECTLEALVLADGWLPWSGDFALKTLYYGEYRNTGAGANTAGRVPWSSQIPAEHVNSYSIRNFIQGDQWITTT